MQRDTKLIAYRGVGVSLVRSRASHFAETRECLQILPASYVDVLDQNVELDLFYVLQIRLVRSEPLVYLVNCVLGNVNHQIIQRAAALQQLLQIQQVIPILEPRI